MSYKLLLCWDDDEIDEELDQADIPLRLGEHELMRIGTTSRYGHRSITITATVRAAGEEHQHG